MIAGPYKDFFLHTYSVPYEPEIGEIRYCEADGDRPKEYDEPLLEAHGVQGVVEELFYLIRNECW